MQDGKFLDLPSGCNDPERAEYQTMCSVNWLDVAIYA